MEGYEEIKSVGENSIVCKRTKDGRFFFVKKIPFVNLDQRQKEKLIERINTFVKLTVNTRAIARLHNPFVAGQNINLPIEYFEDNSLDKIIKLTLQDGKKLSDDFIWEVIGKIAFELYDLHTQSQPVGHGRIRTDNIFIPSKNVVKLGLCGFDLDRKYTPQNDMYQLGVVIYEMVTLSSFDPKASKHSLDRKLSHCDQSLRKLILALVQEDSEKRPNVVYVLQVLEVAVVVQEIKLSIAKEQNEEEKRKVAALEQELEGKKK